MQRKRRDILRLFSVTGAFLAAPFIDWNHIESALNKPSLMDGELIQDLENINRYYWRVFRNAPSKRIVLDGVIGQLRVITELLRNPSSPEMYQHLCRLISDLSQLAGEIFFDINNYHTAQSCYVFAASAAKEARHHDLWACSLIRHAFLPIYDQQYADALPLLQQASYLANKGDSALVTRFWVAAVEADAQAGTQNLACCQRALELAQEVQHIKQGSNGAWLRYDEERLAEQRGACFVKLTRPDLAEPALQEALSIKGLSLRRQGLILADLAFAAIQLQDIERACQYGIDLLTLLQQGKSGVLEKSIQRVTGQLQPFQRVPAVKTLEQQFQSLLLEQTTLIE